MVRGGTVRYLLLVVAAAAIFAAAVTAHAQQPDGSKMLRACGASVKQADGGSVTEEEAVLSVYCLGYISGFLDSMALTVGTTSGRQNVCLPQQGISNNQAVRIFV